MSNSAFRASQICKTVFILENIAVSENVPEHGSVFFYTAFLCNLFLYRNFPCVFSQHAQTQIFGTLSQRGLQFLLDINFLN